MKLQSLILTYNLLILWVCNMLILYYVGYTVNYVFIILIIRFKGLYMYNLTIYIYRILIRCLYILYNFKFNSHCDAFMLVLLFCYTIGLGEHKFSCFKEEVLEEWSDTRMFEVSRSLCELWIARLICTKRKIWSESCPDPQVLHTAFASASKENVLLTAEAVNVT